MPPRRLCNKSNFVLQTGGASPSPTTKRSVTALIRRGDSEVARPNAYCNQHYACHRKSSDWRYILEILFFLVFGLVLSVFVFAFVNIVKEWHKNNNSPRLTVPARIVAKRTNVSRHKNASGHGHHTSTTYFVTFEFESTDRLELRLRGNEYGLLVEGDHGKLTFQGTRYLGFERI